LVLSFNHIQGKAYLYVARKLIICWTEGVVKRQHLSVYWTACCTCTDWISPGPGRDMLLYRNYCIHVYKQHAHVVKNTAYPFIFVKSILQIFTWVNFYLYM
jgi:hypothetical protein